MLKLPLLCAVLAVATNLAPQLVLKADHESIVAIRIQGAWKLAAATSDQLDSKRVATAAPKDLTFTDNPGVIAGLQAHSERFKNMPVIGSGIVNVDGTTHPYILVAEHGGTSLSWFTGNAAGTDPVATVTTKNVTIACGREPALDMLFLGGDLRGSASLAYVHAAPATR